MSRVFRLILSALDRAGYRTDARWGLPYISNVPSLGHKKCWSA